MELTLGGAVVLALVISSYTVSGIPSVPCSPSKQVEFVKDDVNVCGYYLCNGGAYQADPATGNLYLPCAPGTSTRTAAERSLYTPCNSFDVKCTGIVPSVTYHAAGSDSNNNGQGHHGTTTTKRPLSSRQPITSGSGPATTRMPTQGPSYTIGSTMTTFSRPVAVFTNAQVAGGRHLVAIRINNGPVMPVTSRPLCHRACDLNVTCAAFEWEDTSASCWIHTELTACGHPVLKEGSDHVRLVACGEGATVQPQHPESSTTTYRPAPTTMAPPHSGIEGFSESHIDAHVKEGKLVLTKATLDACLFYCAHFPKCEAVDFDRYSETCWLHEAKTACGEIVSKSGCTHYKRIPCNNNDLAPRFLASFQEVHVAGGSPLCDGCTMTQCQHHCLHHPECAGADYNSIEATCYGHLAETACNKLKPKQGCTHFRRIQCSDGA